MTDGGGAERTGEGDDSIWQSDDIPVRSDPLTIDWDLRHRTAGDQTVRPAREPELPRPDDPSDRHHAGRRLMAGVAAFAAVATVVVLAVRSGEPDQAATTSSTVATETDDSVPDTSTEATSTTTVRTVAADEQPDVIDALELPPAVAAIMVPTEIVTVSEQGLLQTLSLPSGRVRPLALDFAQVGGFGSPQVIVAPDAAAMSTGDAGLVIVPRTGPPIAVEASTFDSSMLGGVTGGSYVSGWQATDDGTAFTVVAAPRQGGSWTQFLVGLDGTVTVSGATGPNPFGYEVLATNGTRIVNDVGGAYELRTDGTSRRIDDGFVYAATDDRRLVRRCDEALQCTFELVTPSTGERRMLDSGPLAENLQSLPYGATLSPDGTAISLQREADMTQRVLVDFALGEVASVPIGGWPQSSQWAADSSGVFDIPAQGDGLQFTGRDGSGSVVFGEELGRIAALGVRWPDAEIESGRTVHEASFTPPDTITDTGITLVAATKGGGLSTIDIDAGEMASWELAHRLGLGSSMLLPIDDRVAAFPDGLAGAFVSSAVDESDLSEVFAVEGTKLPGPTPDTVWVPAGGDTRPNDVVYGLYSITATTPADVIASIDVGSAELLGADGTGGLVVRRGGDVFIVDGSGAETLTRGDLIAIDGATAYVRECDDLTTCRIVRIDRVGGARTSLTGPLETDPGYRALTSDQGAALSTSVSPDGAVLLARLPDVSTDGAGANEVREAWAFADTTSGQVTFVDELDAAQPVIWAADGRVAVVVADSKLQLFDRAAGRMVALDLPAVTAIAPLPGWATGP